MPEDLAAFDPKQLFRPGPLLDLEQLLSMDLDLEPDFCKEVAPPVAVAPTQELLDAPTG